MLCKQESCFEEDKLEWMVWKEALLKPKNIQNTEKLYHPYLLAVSLHFKLMSFNLELFGAEQFSTVHYNEQNVLLHMFSFNIDACNFGGLIKHFWELFYSALNASRTTLSHGTGLGLDDTTVLMVNISEICAFREITGIKPLRSPFNKIKKIKEAKPP